VQEPRLILWRPARSHRSSPCVLRSLCGFLCHHSLRPPASSSVTWPCRPPLVRSFATTSLSSKNAGVGRPASMHGARAKPAAFFGGDPDCRDHVACLRDRLRCFEGKSEERWHGYESRKDYVLRVGWESICEWRIGLRMLTNTCRDRAINKADATFAHGQQR
jgi:hypothetical protein